MTRQLAIKAPRNELAVLAVTGADAVSFLHGQFSADINALKDGEAVLTAWCSPQGRVLFLPWVIRTGDTFHLLIPHDMCAAIHKRLRMFVLRAAVAIEDVSAAHAVIEIHGGTALEIPGSVSAATTTARRFVLTCAETRDATWNALDLPAADEAELARRDIADAVPRLTPATSDRFLPQELGLDEHGGLSFDKGCYPGQEIIARVRYRGRLKRRPVVLKGNTSTPLEPGTRLMHDAEHHGTVLMSALDENASTLDVLAVLDEGFDELHCEPPERCVLRRAGPGEDGIES